MREAADSYVMGYADGHADGAHDTDDRPQMVSERLAVLQDDLRHARDFAVTARDRDLGERNRAYVVGSARGYRAGAGVGG